MKKQIVWSNESEPLRFIPQEGVFKKDKDVVDEDETVDFDELAERLQLKKIMQTSLGNYIVEDELNPIRNMQFWRFDTNFNISRKVEKAIEETDGVDILRILTRYSGCLAVGKAFSFRDVRTAIDQKLCGTAPSSSAEEIALEKLKVELKDFKQWVIYEFPHGVIDYVYLEDDKSNAVEFVEKVKLFEECKKLSNGNLIRSL